jgi:hypothetical protein
MKKTQELYDAHFGPLFDFREVWLVTRAPPFLVMRFWTGAQPIIYASMGAPGHEVVLASTVPFGPFDIAVEQLAGMAAAYAPSDVVPYAMAGTPFVAALLLPLGEGTLDLGLSEGVRRVALRAVPLTRAERVLAKEDPRKALDVLRRAGALVADPLRSCTLDPARNDFWVHRLPWLHACVAERLRDSTEYIAHMQARGAPIENLAQRERLDTMRRALLAHLEAAPLPAPRTPGGADIARHRSIAAVGGKLIERAFSGFREVITPQMEEVLTELMVATLATHPEAVRLLREVREGEVTEPYPSNEEVSSRLADVIAGWHVDVDLEALVAVGQRAYERAFADFDDRIGRPRDEYIWGKVFGAMYRYVHACPVDGGENASSKGERAVIATAFQRTAENGTLFITCPGEGEPCDDDDNDDDGAPREDEDKDEDEEDDDDMPQEVMSPALERLAGACSILVIRMMFLLSMRQKKAAHH